MNCTKCNGTGSEGYLSFLRCGRCGATGKEPKDSLVPYSQELILVPDKPVITALKEDPEVVKKKLEPDLGPSYVPPAPLRAPAPPGRHPSGYSPYSYAGFESNRAYCNNHTEEKEKEPCVQPISQFFKMGLRLGGGGVAQTHGMHFNFTHLSQDLYSQDLFLHEIDFNSKGNYMVRAQHQGCIILESFYTGLGVKAVMESAVKIYPHNEITFYLEPQDKNPALNEDCMALTVWVEKRVKESQIYRPVYPMHSPRTY